MKTVVQNTALELEPCARPTKIHWAVSLLVLLMAVGSVLPISHRAITTIPQATKGEDMTALINEGTRYRTPEAGVFIDR